MCICIQTYTYGRTSLTTHCSTKHPLNPKPLSPFQSTRLRPVNLLPEPHSPLLPSPSLTSSSTFPTPPSAVAPILLQLASSIPKQRAWLQNMNPSPQSRLLFSRRKPFRCFYFENSPSSVFLPHPPLSFFPNLLPPSHPLLLPVSPMTVFPLLCNVPLLRYTLLLILLPNLSARTCTGTHLHQYASSTVFPDTLPIPFFRILFNPHFPTPPLLPVHNNSGLNVR